MRHFYLISALSIALGLGLLGERQARAEVPAQAPVAEHTGRDTFSDWQRQADAAPSNHDVLFNAALAASRADEPGWARLYLERLRVLRPMDREVRHSLALVRQNISRAQIEDLADESYTDGELRGMWWWRASRFVPEGTSATLLLLFIWLGAGLWLVSGSLRAGTLRNTLRGIAWLAAAFALCFAALWVGARTTDAALQPAVVTANDTSYRLSPDVLQPSHTSRELHPGALVSAGRTVDSWTEVELADGEQVWVASDAVSRVVPPGVGRSYQE